MINKILYFFGLIKISRVKRLTRHLHIHYVSCVLHGVEEDFKVSRKPDAIQKENEWWNSEFDSILLHHSDDVKITTIPTFGDYK